MVEYGERLRAAMKARDVSIQKLADKLNVSYQAVKKVLDGKSSAFNAPNHVIAARTLGVSSEWLALGEGEMEIREGQNVSRWPFGDFDRYEDLSEDKKRELSRIVDAFLAGAAPGKSNAA